MTLRLAVFLLVWVLAAAPATAQQQPDLDEVLARAATFVAQYENNLDSILVADERARQESGPAGNPALSSGRGSRPLVPQVRELESEFLLVHLPELETQWIALRHVLQVDGRPVRDNQRRFEVAAYRRSPEGTIAEWKRLHDEGARYNIGPIGRTINIPTLALVVLRADYQAQFAFRIEDARASVEGFDTVVLAYEELDPPTLVAGFDGERVQISGRLWITPADGRVVRTELATQFARVGARIAARVTTHYGLDRQLEAWVPMQMDEQYTAGAFRVQCVSRYSKFRWLDANR